jgi:hypothetical protein
MTAASRFAWLTPIEPNIPQESDIVRPSAPVRIECANSRLFQMVRVHKICNATNFCHFSLKITTWHRQRVGDDGGRESLDADPLLARASKCPEKSYPCHVRPQIPSGFSKVVLKLNSWTFSAQFDGALASLLAMLNCVAFLCFGGVSGALFRTTAQDGRESG